MDSEQEPRSPDHYYNDVLLPTNYDTDAELNLILEQSRNEYLALEKARMEKEALKTRLSVPISRLVLWKNTTLHANEKHFLSLIIHILRACTSESDHQDIGVIHDMDGLRSFLDIHLKSSPLFREVYQVCQEYL